MYFALQIAYQSKMCVCTCILEVHACRLLYGLRVNFNFAGQLDLKWCQDTAKSSESLHACTDNSEFGQLPMLMDGDITISKVWLNCLFAFIT